MNEYAFTVPIYQQSTLLCQPPMARGCKCYQSKGPYKPHRDPSNQMNYFLGNVWLCKECAHRCVLWFLLSRGVLLPSEAKLGHVVSCACCTAHAPDLRRVPSTFLKSQARVPEQRCWDPELSDSCPHTCVAIRLLVSQPGC